MIVANWQSSVSETYSFNTTIFTSRSGREQRSAEMLSPRRQVSFQALLAHEAARAFAAVLHDRGAGELTIPDPARRGALLMAEAAAGATQITVDAVPVWLVSGAALTIASESAVAVAAVAAVAGNLVTLSQPLVAPWPAGSELRPAVTGRLPISVPLQRATDSHATAQIQFSLTPPANLPVLDVAAPPTYRGRDVLIHKPNWLAPPSVSYDTSYETVDYGRGVSLAFLPVDFYTRISQFTYTGDRKTVSGVLDLFIRQRGRQGEFWCPSWTSDMMAVGEAVVGSSLLTIEGKTVMEHEGSEVDRAIGILMNDGTWAFRRVLAFIPGSTNTILLLDQSIDQSGSISMICWLNICRFASDALTVQWYSEEVAQCVAQIMTLEYLNP